MQRDEVLRQVKAYIAQHTLEGRDVGLDESTPLLAWGLLDSFKIVMLLTFIQRQFHILVPSEKIVANHFSNLAAITDLVLEIANEHLVEQ